MTRYPIGTRVRIVGASKVYYYMRGKEAIITGYVDKELYPMSGDYTLEIPFTAPPAGKEAWSCAHTDIEPLLSDYDGHETTTWDKLPWQPEGATL